MRNREIIAELLKSYDSFYLYDQRIMEERIQRLNRDFEGVEFLYSIKTNAAPAVVKCVFDQGFGADAASIGEVRLAHAAGLPKDKIHYSAPGKRAADIGDALPVSTVIADSLEELSIIQEIARAKGITAEIGLRINPNFTVCGDAGVPSKFGIDEEQVFKAIPMLKGLSHVSVVGLHVHIKSQELDAGALARYYDKLLDLTDRVQAAMGRRLEFVNMGSGLGIPYASQDAPLDTKRLGLALAARLSACRKRLGNVRVVIETGRYVVGESGCYVAKVLDKKTSMGTVYVILCNTLNGFLRPSLARLVLRYAERPPAAGCEPLFTGCDAFQFEALTDSGEMETVTLAGNLCTAADEIARDVVLPKLKRGDAVVITNAGSYGAVLSPVQFSSQTPPAQLFLCRGGRVRDAFAEE